MIERPFELPLGVLDINTRLQLPDWPEPRLVKSVHVAWSGKIDLLATVAHRNRVVDHKTTSIAGDNYIPSFILLHQTIGYVWAARQLWPHLDITGFCLNAIYLRRPLPGTTSLVARGATQRSASRSTSSAPISNTRRNAWSSGRPIA